MKSTPILFACLVITSVAQAEVIRQPLELEAGDRYRFIFVTSKTTQALSSDIEFYNDFVQSVADAAPIGDWGLEWKAIGTTEAVNSRQNTSTEPGVDEDASVYLLDGTFLLSDYEILWSLSDRSVLSNLGVNEFGVRLPDTRDEDRVWTGSNEHGLQRPTLDGVSHTLGAESAWVGFSDDVSRAWFYDNVSNFTRAEFPMFAMSEVIVAVPEPVDFTALIFLLLAIHHVRRK